VKALARPGGALWLLLHELRLFFRSGDKPKKGARFWLIFALIFVAAALLGGGWVVAELLSLAPQNISKPALLIAIGAIAFLFTLMVSQALNGVIDAVYTRADLDLLLSSPIDPWTVLFVRLFAVAIRTCMLYLGFAAAVMVFAAIGGDWRWLALGPGIIAIALVATAISILAASALFRWIGPRGARVLVQVLAAVVGASIFLGFQIQNFLPREERAGFFQSLWDGANALPVAPEHWAAFPARAFLGDGLAALVLVALGAVSFLGAVTWFSRRFVSDAAAIAGMGAARRRTASPAKPFRAGLAATMVAKEWRVLFRDPTLLSQVLLQLIYLAPLVFILIREALDGGVGAGVLGVGAGALAIIAASLAGSLTWVTVSAEQAPDLIAAAPIESKAGDRAKLAAAVIPVAILMAIAFGLMALVAPGAAAFGFPGAIAAALSAGLLGVRYRRPGQRAQFNRRSHGSWKAALAQSFVAGNWSSATGIAAAGLWPVALIPGLIALGVLLALLEREPISPPPIPAPARAGRPRIRRPALR
jgi:ABC-2 type transport system permease protein